MQSVSYKVIDRARANVQQRVIDWKGKANRLSNVSVYEELEGYYTEVMDFKTFLLNELPEFVEYLRLKATIKGDFNLDLQSKGVAGAITRANAKVKRDERLLALAGKAKTSFVPLARKMLNTLYSRSNQKGEKYKSVEGKSSSCLNGPARPGEQ